MRLFLVHLLQHSRSPMNSAVACPACGTPLPPDLPAGALCPACERAEAEVTVLGVTSDTPSSGVQNATVHQSLGTVGDYEILDKLGEGGMGAVYRARQLMLDRLVALKLLPPHAMDDDDRVRRFQREATLAAGLNHPNLVRVFTSGQAGGSFYIAMELVDGENLRQRLDRGSLPMGEAITICLGVAKGLRCGWQRANLVHRDIKPSNIYLSRNGEVKLGDLGIAKSFSEDASYLTQTGVAMGTAHYMSPEQARGEKELDFRADIYSLGFTLYEALTGQPGYRGTQPGILINQHLNSPAPGILKVLPDCPMCVVRLFGKMVRKSRHERHASYDELIGQMENVLSQLEDPSMGTLLAQTAPPSIPSQRRPAGSAVSTTSSNQSSGWLSALVTLVMAGAAAFFIWSSGSIFKLTPRKEVARASTPTETKPATAATARGWQPMQRNANGEWRGARSDISAQAVVIRHRTHRRDGANYRALLIGPGTVSLGLILPPDGATLSRRETDDRFLEFVKTIPEIPFQVGQESSIEFARVGTRVFATVDGQFMGPVDLGLDWASLGVGVMGAPDEDSPPEYLVLDGVPESQWPDSVRFGVQKETLVRIAPPPGANPSFEDVNRQGEPKNWVFRNWFNRGSGTSVVLKGAPQGERVLYMKPSDDRCDSGFMTYVWAKPNTRYRLSARIKTRDVKGSGTGAFVGCFRDGAGAGEAEGFRTQGLLGNNDWTYVEREFLNESQTIITLRCILGGYGESSGEAWFDDVQLTEVGTTAAPSNQ
jgi:serine/threonine protein kinase